MPYAFSKAAKSIFFIVSIACMARPPFSLSIISAPILSGIICQETPKGSFSQPHMLSSPPLAVSFSQKKSISAWSLHSTTNEMPSLKSNACLPAPSMAIKTLPSSVNCECFTVPASSSPSSSAYNNIPSMAESGKRLVYNITAASA